MSVECWWSCSGGDNTFQRLTGLTHGERKPAIAAVLVSIGVRCRRPFVNSDPSTACLRSLCNRPGMVSTPLLGRSGIGLPQAQATCFRFDLLRSKYDFRSYE